MDELEKELNSTLRKLNSIMTKKKWGYEKTARELGISWKTVYRWFKKETYPSRLALSAIKELIKKNAN